MGWSGRLGRWGVVSVCALIAVPSALGAPPPAAPTCPAPTAQTFSSTAAVPLTDNGVTTSSIVVSGMASPIWDVDIVTHLPHESSGQLVVTLKSPSGKEIVLSDQWGETTANAFAATTWNDGANPGGESTSLRNDGLVTLRDFAAAGPAANLVPEEALGAFVGDDPNGTWTVSVTDLVPGGTGTLTDWALVIAADPAGPSSLSGGSRVTGSGVTIPNGGTASTSLVVGDGPQGLRWFGGLRTVGVNFSAFSYAGVGDLTATLRSPRGTLITLTGSNPIPDPSNLPVTWRDPSGPYVGFSPITPASSATSWIAIGPEESFSAVAGEDPEGTWTLTLTDAGALPGGGSLGGWSVTPFAATNCASTVTYALDATPSALLGVRYSMTARATVAGSGNASRQSLTVFPPTDLRDPVIAPTSGGTCSPWSSAALGLTCVWPGYGPPGTVRAVTVSGVFWRSAPLTSRVAMNGSTVWPATPSPPLPSLASSDIRVLRNPALRASDGRMCTVVGTLGNDVLRSPAISLAEVICGLGGNDVLRGSKLQETLDGGAGNDLIVGREGNDRIFGSKGNDTIVGGAGVDTIDGGAGRDAIDAGPGNDRIIGGLGKDKINGGTGKDKAKRDPQDTFKGIEVFFRR